MAKTKKSANTKQDPLVKVLTGIIVLLVVLCGSLFVAIAYYFDRRAVSIYPVAGADILYKVENGKAVERDDQAANELREFLAGLDAESGCKPNSSGRHVINFANRDITQVLLGYGCYNTDSKMFAIKKDGQWQTISPANKFDLFGVPACNHVNEYNISRDIAPVCVSNYETQNPIYKLR